MRTKEMARNPTRWQSKDTFNYLKKTEIYAAFTSFSGKVPNG